MPALHLLGTGAGYSESHRTTTMLAFSDGNNLLVIDCGGDVVQRILAAGQNPLNLKHFILTHAHADHLSGFPLFMERIWLAGRRNDIPVYGPPEALDQAQRTFATFDTSGWEGLPACIWNTIPHEKPGIVIIDDSSWEVRASSVQHSIPTMGFRVHCKPTDKVVAYSCDTEPAESVVKLARGADILVHEATGPFPGHSSAAQAAEIAVKAGVQRLILVHLPANLNQDDLIKAKAIFPYTEWGEELGSYEL